jgi:MYXO-CTERM domain-containing protein
VTPPKKDEGCGCAVGSTATESVLALGSLLVVGLLLGLRRRSR